MHLFILCYKRFLAVMQKKEENVSLLLLRATNCSPLWEQILSINENIKTDLNSISVQTFSQCQGLNPKFDKMSVFDLIFIQPVKNYIEKKTRVIIDFEFTFFGLSDFYLFCDSENLNRRNFLSKTWIFSWNLFQKFFESEQNFL